MRIRKFSTFIATAVSLVALAALTAQATGTTADGSVVRVDHVGEKGAGASVLTVTFAKQLAPAKLAEVQGLLESQTQAPSVGVRSSKLEASSQARKAPICTATTPIPSRTRTATTRSSTPAAERRARVCVGGARNGANQARQAAHVTGCTYQFHGTYNPDDDYDYITYSDTLTFEIEIDGETGSADLNIIGSFTSAGCSSGKACGL